MDWLVTLLSYVFVQTFGLLIAYVASGVLIYLILSKLHSRDVAIALARLDRGAWGVLHVEGPADPSIFDGIIESGGGH